MCLYVCLAAGLKEIVEPRFLMPDTYSSLFPLAGEFLSKGLVDKVYSAYRTHGDSEKVCQVLKHEQAKALENYKRIRAAEFCHLQGLVASQLAPQSEEKGDVPDATDLPSQAVLNFGTGHEDLWADAIPAEWQPSEESSDVVVLGQRLASDEDEGGESDVVVTGSASGSASSITSHMSKRRKRKLSETITLSSSDSSDDDTPKTKRAKKTE